MEVGSIILFKYRHGNHKRHILILKEFIFQWNKKYKITNGDKCYKGKHQRAKRKEYVFVCVCLCACEKCGLLDCWGPGQVIDIPKPLFLPLYNGNEKTVYFVVLPINFFQ